MHVSLESLATVTQAPGSRVPGVLPRLQLRRCQATERNLAVRRSERAGSWGSYVMSSLSALGHGVESLFCYQNKALANTKLRPDLGPTETGMTCKFWRFWCVYGITCCPLLGLLVVHCWDTRIRCEGM